MMARNRRGPARQVAGQPPVNSAAIETHPNGAVLNLVVTPRSGKTAFAGLEGDSVRLRVAAPPVDGAANAAIVKFLADATGVPKSAVRIVSGETGRRKRVVLEGVSIETLAARLGEAGTVKN